MRRPSNVERELTDRGSILPLVLVVSIALSMVVVALAKYVTVDLRYARVAEERVERQSAATSAITYGVERIRLAQTLCASPAGDFGPMTPGLLDSADTTTTLTCQRLSGGPSDITGWAIIVTGNGISSNLLDAEGSGAKDVDGAVYVDDVGEVDVSGGDLRIVDADVWHHRSTCPGGPVSLPGRLKFVPADVRGPLCTTATSTQLLSTPPVPNLNALPPMAGSSYDDTTWPGCRVFAPGHYTGPAPELPNPGDVYFQSGSYWFDSVGEIDIDDTTVWFGNPGVTSPDITNSGCGQARIDDPNTGGPGAIAYMGGTSRFKVEHGAIEFFGRDVSGVPLSVQELQPGSGYPPSTRTAASNQAIVDVDDDWGAQAVLHGLVYTPNSEFRFDNDTSNGTQSATGGVVAARVSSAPVELDAVRGLGRIDALARRGPPDRDVDLDEQWSGHQGPGGRRVPRRRIRPHPEGRRQLAPLVGRLNLPAES